MEKQTESAAIRDYLQAWQSLGNAFEQNRPELLQQDFIGDARDKLGATIQEQKNLAIRTRYRDRAHDLQVVFYSPDGLSIELLDKAEYDVQIIEHDQAKAVRRVSARYVAVLTPSEVRWRVRILQSE